MSHRGCRGRRGRLESCTWTTLLVTVSAVAMVLLLQAAHRG
ncbi:hypothetical protein [Streptomyces sp. ICN903]|nr:hypothetical protein [Streptomyces sp. ICN903]